MSNYTYRDNPCQCHPESCNCDSIEILDPDGVRITTAYDEEQAKVLLSHLNRPVGTSQDVAEQSASQADKALRIIAGLRSTALNMLGEQFDAALSQTATAYSTPESIDAQAKINICHAALQAAKIGLRDWEVPVNRYKALDTINEALAELSSVPEVDATVESAAHKLGELLRGLHCGPDIAAMPSDFLFSLGQKIATQAKKAPDASLAEGAPDFNLIPLPAPDNPKRFLAGDLFCYSEQKLREMYKQGYQFGHADGYAFCVSRATEEESDFVTRESALEAIEHVASYNGPGRDTDAANMLVSANVPAPTTSATPIAYKRLPAAAVRELAVTHAEACNGGEYYQFNQEGLDAFAIAVMDGLFAAPRFTDENLGKTVNAYCNDLSDCAAALDEDSRFKIYAVEIRMVVNALRAAIPIKGIETSFCSASTAAVPATGLPYTEDDLLELVGIAKDMKEIDHWRMKAGSKLLAEILAKLLEPLKAAHTASPKS
jgi:hypothetical protein